MRWDVVAIERNEDSRWLVTSSAVMRKESEIQSEFLHVASDFLTASWVFRFL